MPSGYLDVSLVQINAEILGRREVACISARLASNIQNAPDAADIVVDDSTGSGSPRLRRANSLPEDEGPTHDLIERFDLILVNSFLYHSDTPVASTAPESRLTL